MKTFAPLAGLVVLLLAVVSPWTVGPAVPQEATPLAVRGVAVVDFSGDPVQSARMLFREAGFLSPQTRRWTRLAPDGRPCVSPRPTAAVLNVLLLRPSGRQVTFKRGGTPFNIEGVVFVGAARDDDLTLVEEYLERCYSHVDIYRAHDEVR